VRSAITELLPTAHLAGSADEADALEVRVADEGERYRVVIAGAARTVEDGARRCDERARTAAVFVVLVLQPPSVAIDEAPVAAPPPGPPLRAAPVTPPPTGSTGPRVEVELSAQLALPVRPVFDGAVTAGGGVRIGVGGSLVSVTAGAALLAPATLRLPTGSVDLLRAPFDVDLRLAGRRGSVEVAGELGLAVALLHAQGHGFTVDESAFGAEVGVRAAGHLRWWLTDRVGVSLALQAVAVPAPARLIVSPAGVVGEAPFLWLAASFGAVVRLH
jgi:hypothetical protein